MKYFEIERNDGKKWRVAKMMDFLRANDIVHMERSMRASHIDGEFKKDKKTGNKYRSVRFKVDSFDGIEFGEIGVKKEVVFEDYSEPKENTKEEIEYRELAENYVKVKRQLQKTQDTLRIERKGFRESNREINAIEELSRELIDIIKNNYSEIKTEFIEIENKESPIGLVQWTDLHGNEQVDIIGNKYNWDVLSKRLRKQTIENIKIFKSIGVEEVLIAGLGDFVNSDRRLSEILLNATNRAKAVFILSEILIGAMLEYKKHFNIHFASICGNESRIDEDIHFEDQIASNNFDYMIHRIILTALKDKEGINFIPTQNPMEQIIEVNNQNILILHGHTIKNVQNTIPKIKAKYADNGIIIRFVLHGHIHETLTGSSSSRGASTTGNNAYSFYGLHLSGRASQNAHIICKDGTIHSFTIDLQNYEEIEGYSFNSDFKEYHSKSVDKYKELNGIKIYKV